MVFMMDTLKMGEMPYKMLTLYRIRLFLGDYPIKMLTFIENSPVFA